jgi:hypothetical protein
MLLTKMLPVIIFYGLLLTFRPRPRPKEKSNK